MRFVIADDNGIARGLLKGAIVVDCGFQVVGEARSGEEALEMCKKLRPDVAVLDNNMPPMDGIEVMKTIEEHGWAKTVIIASLAQHLIEELRAKGYKVLAKPFKREQLADKIRAALA
jgi:CheY-like chemotaxis protein